MKQSIGKMIIRGFIKSFFIVILLVGVSVLSYKAVMYFGKGQDSETVLITEEKEKEKEKSITKPSIDDISKNLVYAVNDETGEIEHILLEIFHCEKKRLYYITIPVRTQFTMSELLYQRLIVVNPTMPQIVKLSGIYKYFNPETAYEYGVWMIEDLLNIKISYYTVIPQSVYEEMFTTEKKKNEYSHVIQKAVFSKGYEEFLKSIQTEEDIRKYIEELYLSIQSNLSVKDKLNYVYSYRNTTRNNIVFDILPGEDTNSAYIINEALARQQIEACIAGDKLENEKD